MRFQLPVKRIIEACDACLKAIDDYRRKEDELTIKRRIADRGKWLRRTRVSGGVYEGDELYGYVWKWREMTREEAMASLRWKEGDKPHDWSYYRQKDAVALIRAAALALDDTPGELHYLELSGADFEHICTYYKLKGKK